MDGMIRTYNTLLQQRKREDVSQDGIDFKETIVNKILLSKISDFLLGKDIIHPDTIIEFGVQAHKISRVGYWLMELGRGINTEEMMREKQREIIARGEYIDCGWCYHNGKYYLIMNRLTSRDTGVVVKKTRTDTNSLVSGHRK